MRGWQQELSSWRDEAAAKTTMLSRERGEKKYRHLSLLHPIDQTQPNTSNQGSLGEGHITVTLVAQSRENDGRGHKRTISNRDVKGDSEEALLKAVFEVS